MSTQKSLSILWSGNSARVACQLMICSTATPPDLGVAPEPLPESLHLIPEFRDYPHSPGGLHLNFHRVSRDCREFGLMRMALSWNCTIVLTSAMNSVVQYSCTGTTSIQCAREVAALTVLPCTRWRHPRSYRARSPGCRHLGIWH